MIVLVFDLDISRRELERDKRAVLSSMVFNHGFVMNVVAPVEVMPRRPVEVRPCVRYVFIRTVPAEGELHVPWKNL